MEQLDFLREVKKHVIIAILTNDHFKDRLVLKGGNLLDVAYELSARASVDIDLSMDDEFADVNKLCAAAESALSERFLQHGYVLFDFRLREVPPKLSDELKHFWGGYKIEFKIILRDKHQQLQGDLRSLQRQAANVGKKGSTVFTIDISRHEFCDDKELFEVDGRSIYGYSPSMVVAEKLRAICQQMDEYVEIVHLNPRARARDFVDIHIVAEHYAIDFARGDFHRVVRSTFDHKKVPLHLLEAIRESRDQHEDDFLAVKATVHPDFDLQDFGFYFEYVCRQCESLKPLWNV